MGKAPAAVFIARHGARLDAADEQWHLTSPAPYDPPLTYGGWIQSRNLGIRIGSLLQAQDDGVSQEIHRSGSTGSSTAQPAKGNLGKTVESPKERQEKRPRKYRVIIHTSPYLRCIQTAISVSSGISQARGGYPQGRTQSSPDPGTQLRSSLLPVGGGDSGNSSQGTTTQESDNPRAAVADESLPEDHIQSCHLRLDAFLGEWLTPDYFEQITPPPSSVMMLTSAKGELLRRGETPEAAKADAGMAGRGNFPGGWNASELGASSAATQDQSDPLDSMSSMNGALPSPRISGYDGTNLSTPRPRKNEPYVPTTPPYAISPSDPIPPGYVQHAREACVEVDYQWDSMKEPQSWGTGGEYGEEWSSMHRRFRTGLERMVDWYKQNEAPDDDETETVLVVVTHGAGCNALIGALTNRPALIDVGMASMTMAIRKDLPQAGYSENKSPTDPNRSTTGVSDEYWPKYVASSDHLRVGSNPFIPQPQQQQSSSSGFAASMAPYRNRLYSTSSTVTPIDSFSMAESATRSFNSRRVSFAPHRSTSVTRSSSGLWGSDSAPDSVDDIIPTFEEPLGADSEGTAQRQQSTERPPFQHGLWSRSPGSQQDRDPWSKRRWTVVDNNP